jgi:hypothetical protein
MAWNEPGGDKNNDPWGNRRKQDGPPDLDELIKKFQNKLRRLFGGKGGSDDGKGGSSALWILILVGVVIWLLSGFFIVQPNEQVIVLRFGKPQVETVGPGHVLVNRRWRQWVRVRTGIYLIQSKVSSVSTSVRNAVSRRMPQC